MFSLKRLHLDILETINDGSEQLYDDSDLQNGKFEAKCGEVKKEFETKCPYFGQFSKPGDKFEFIEQVYTTNLGPRVSGHLVFKFKGKC